ncbi:hypothetical protein B0H13DRAFT_1026407 [Mycena leptocephala]|nr:hypothetical protein B0H13DRAFT_1026407 [Mycena leptocephala]
MRCVSSAPLIPTSTPTSIIFSLLFLPLDIHSVFLLQIECHTRPIPIWARRRSYIDARGPETACVVRGSGSRCYGALVCGSRTRAACTRRDLPCAPLNLVDSPISMAFIGPNIFCCHSIFTSFSADFAAYSLLFHSLSLDFTRALRTAARRRAHPHPPAAPFPSTPAPTPSRPRRRHHAIRPC